MPEATYDSEADILYVRLRDSETVARQTFLDDVRIIDHSEEGTVVGIEFIDASDGVILGGRAIRKAGRGPDRSQRALVQDPRLTKLTLWTAGR